MKNGLWQQADRGTLFLDEIGDLPLINQVKILRTLETGVIRPIGGQEVKVNARVIVATNRDLFAMTRTGQFREDLYYRLRGFFIPTPALGDHPEDIPLMARSLWQEITGKSHQVLPDPILVELQNLSWPGNVRGLKMLLQGFHSLFHNVEKLGV